MEFYDELDLISVIKDNTCFKEVNFEIYNNLDNLKDNFLLYGGYKPEEVLNVVNIEEGVNLDYYLIYDSEKNAILNINDNIKRITSELFDALFIEDISDRIGVLLRINEDEQALKEIRYYMKPKYRETVENNAYIENEAFYIDILRLFDSYDYFM